MRTALIILSLLGSLSLKAQTYGQMKVWDSHERHPKITSIEFEEPDMQLATYDAVYGHGAMMENPYYGLRVYIDQRQNIDLYGKRKAAAELMTTDFYTTR